MKAKIKFKILIFKYIIAKKSKSTSKDEYWKLKDIFMSKIIHTLSHEKLKIYKLVGM